MMFFIWGGGKRKGKNMAKKQPIIDQTTVYRFCGNGQGIPGLPHEVTAIQAKELGVLDVLQAAILNGNYEPVKPSAALVAEPAE
jgi:hypothetical protein